MRIGIDGRELLGQRTGVGRYLADLCAEWLRLPERAQHRFLLYTSAQPDQVPAVLGWPFEGGAHGAFEHRHVGRGTGTWWEQVQLPPAVNKDEVDVFFAPAYSAPLGVRAPVVLTIHDLSFAAHPEWFGWREGLRRRWLARRAVSRAAVVIVVSEFSQKELGEHFDLPADRVRVIRSGVRSPTTTLAEGSGRRDGPRSPEARRSGPDEPIAHDQAARREPLVLFVGSIFNRRHVPDLIEAFARVVREQPNARLAIVGDNRSYPRQDPAALAAAAGVADRVAVHSYVSDAELSTFYARARVFVFLSEYEGFGLTPLEALSGGVPIVVTDTAVARELYGDAAALVPPGDVDGAAAAICRLLRDERARDQALQRAAAVLPRYSWERAARETLAALERGAAHIL